MSCLIWKWTKKTIKDTGKNVRETITSMELFYFSVTDIYYYVALTARKRSTVYIYIYIITSFDSGVLSKFNQ